MAISRNRFRLADSRERDQGNKLTIYNMILKPTWTYGIELWGSARKSNIDRIQSFQSKTLRTILDAPWGATQGGREALPAFLEANGKYKGGGKEAGLTQMWPDRNGPGHPPTTTRNAHRRPHPLSNRQKSLPRLASAGYCLFFQIRNLEQRKNSNASSWDRTGPTAFQAVALSTELSETKRAVRHP
ncbi:hypothetical protein AAG570_001526 [Ranatra chinensis]|uniref:Uncharacterized protein n=1 Tax=Ranatra chinensis TaxID=642074 RepID=A0ABD0Y8R5_9HEMI